MYAQPHLSRMSRVALNTSLAFTLISIASACGAGSAHAQAVKGRAPSTQSDTQTSKTPSQAETMYRVAQDLDTNAVHDEAARLYERFAQKFPQDARAHRSLIRAAELRMRLKDYDQAITDLKTCIKLTKGESADQRQAIEAYFKLGEIYIERAQWSRVIKHYQALSRTFKRASAGDRARAHTLVGNAYRETSRDRAAHTAYRASIKVYEGLTASARDSAELSMRDAVAEAKFWLLNKQFKAFQRLGHSKSNTRDFKNYKTKIARDFQHVISTSREMKSQYEEILGLNVERWGFASLTRMGQLYEVIYMHIKTTPAPPALSDDLKFLGEFRSMMVNQAEPLRKSAMQAYEICISKSRSLQYVDEWTELATERLAALKSLAP